MRKLCAKIVPKNLTIEQKDIRKDARLHLLERIQSDRNFLKKVITGEKTWIFEYDPETKDKIRNNTHLHHHVRKKREWARQKSNPCSSAFLTVKGLSIQNLCLKDKLLISFITMRLLKGQEEELFACDQALLTIGCSITTMPLVTRRSLWWKFWLKGIPVVPQPPYSLDLSPCDFFLLPKLKFQLKGHHFGTVENIGKAVTDERKAISISDFQGCYEEWERLRRCVASQGNYFEGAKLDL